MRVLVCTRLALMALTLLVGGNVSRAPAQTQPVRIVDANGIQIGSDVISIDDAGGFAGQLPRVGFDLDGRVFTLWVIQTGFRSNIPLDYTSPDCSGPPFVEDVSTTVERPLLSRSLRQARRCIYRLLGAPANPLRWALSCSPMGYAGPSRPRTNHSLNQP
jgi:hypothetical protein